MRLRLPRQPGRRRVVDALEHVWNAGGDVLDGEKVIIDSPEAAQGLTLRRSMIVGRIATQSSGTTRRLSRRWSYQRRRGVHAQLALRVRAAQGPQDLADEAGSDGHRAAAARGRGRPELLRPRRLELHSQRCV